LPNGEPAGGFLLHSVEGGMQDVTAPAR
jgi:hypothetical protein